MEIIFSVFTYFGLVPELADIFTTEFAASVFFRLKCVMLTGQWDDSDPIWSIWTETLFRWRQGEGEVLLVVLQLS